MAKKKNSRGGKDITRLAFKVHFSVG